MSYYSNGFIISSLLFSNSTYKSLCSFFVFNVYFMFSFSCSEIYVQVDCSMERNLFSPLQDKVVTTHVLFKMLKTISLSI